MAMDIAEELQVKVRTLPPPMARKVLDFIDYLEYPNDLQHCHDQLLLLRQWTQFFFQTRQQRTLNSVPNLRKSVLENVHILLSFLVVMFVLGKHHDTRKDAH